MSALTERALIGAGIGVSVGLFVGFMLGIQDGINIAHDAEVQGSPALGPFALICLRVPDSDFCKGFKLGSGWEQCAAMRAQLSTGRPLSDAEKVGFIQCVTDR